MFFVFLKINSNINLQKKTFFSIILAVTMLMLFSSIIWFYWESNNASALLKETIDQMNKTQELQIQIEEKGEGYNMNFEGSMNNDMLRGSIPDYSIDILYRQADEELYIKDLKDDEWKNAFEVGLNELKEFFKSPFELLSASASINDNISFIDSDEKKEEIKIVGVHIPQTELEQYTGEKAALNCLVYINKEEMFIPHITYAFIDPESSEEIIERRYFFE